jgi:hypothetical protein
MSGGGNGPTVAQRLAAHYRTLFVSDYATFWERRMGSIGPFELPLVQDAQQAVEDSLARRASRVLFAEADPLELALRRSLEPGSRSRTYDLTLLVESTGRTAGGSSFLDAVETAVRAGGGAVARIGAPTEHELLDRAVYEVDRVLEARGV